tara:strand:+ start:776 stop:967 length:192 start_codon:yes stop_codon:yes gene_type:complete
MNTYRTRHRNDALPCNECLKREAEKQRLRARRIAIAKWLVSIIFQGLYPLFLVVSITEGWMVI